MRSPLLVAVGVFGMASALWFVAIYSYGQSPWWQVEALALGAVANCVSAMYWARPR